jgi:hypothetical protein
MPFSLQRGAKEIPVTDERNHVLDRKARETEIAASSGRLRGGALSP